MSVVIETTIGDFTVDLFTEERPVACLNFIKLCKLKYYNYNLFHTVEQGFIAQTGDPTGAGDGGSSVWGVVEGSSKRFFEAETLPKIHHTNAGLISLVSAGKNLVGSQFFVTLGTELTSLDDVHCVIGEVVEGHDTLRQLNDTIVDEQFRPYKDIRITHTVILDDPYPDPRGFRMPSRSPSPTPERLKNGRIAADEDIDDTDGKTMEELHEMLAEREAKARATILEIVGDLPDAEVAPPENVLFVCKLNPVTTDDDLEIIFSRFGKVKNCEVIRDRKTGDSLQYAFVEFEDKKYCEAAYFKMDNVLIDDRRIHVDFSQSVAKVKWRGKGRGVEGPDGRIDFNNLREENGNRKIRPQKYDSNREYRDRERMNSEERRRAREERHREQAQRDRQRRSQSKTRRYEERQNSAYRDNRRFQDRRDRTLDDKERKNRHIRDDTRFHRREDRRRSRSRARDERRRSIERHRSNQRSPIRSKHHDDVRLRGRRPQERSADTGKSYQSIEPSKHKKDLKKIKKKGKRSRNDRSSEDTEDETDSTTDSSEDSASSSSTESDSESSSEEERKRKKKSKKSKNKKSKSSKKKHKK